MSDSNSGGGERILDLGAGRGWAAKQFSLRGCTVVALDIASDENVGLGRAKALMEDAGTYFERVIADGERLPFHPETFDVVFCNASLHHSSNIPLLLQNVSKVLKQGGRFCAIEPSISILESEEDVLARYATAELELNINENRPNFLQYREGLESNGLSITEAFPTHTYYMGAHDLAEWARDMGAISPALRIRQPLRTMSRLATFLAKRARAMYMGKPRPPGGLSDERQRLIQATLWWADNELFLLATKESRPVVPEEDVTAPVQKRL